MKIKSNKFEAGRRIGTQLITVRLMATNKKYGDKTGVPIIYEPYDITKIKKPKKVIGNYLPSSFEVTGLPCKVSFTLDQVEAKTAKQKNLMQITHITFDCENGLVNSELPINLLRSLAIQASTFVAEITPANTRTQIAPNAYEQTDSKGGFVVLGQSSSSKQREKDFLGIQPTGKDLYEQIGHLYSTLPYGTKYKLIAQAFGRGNAWAFKHTAKGHDLYPQFFKGYKTKTKKQKGKK